MRLVKKSDKMARKMTMSNQIAMISGGVLALIAVALLINGIMLVGGIAFALGALLILVGKKM